MKFLGKLSLKGKKQRQSLRRVWLWMYVKIQLTGLVLVGWMWTVRKERHQIWPQGLWLEQRKEKLLEGHKFHSYTASGLLFTKHSNRAHVMELTSTWHFLMVAPTCFILHALRESLFMSHKPGILILSSPNISSSFHCGFFPTVMYFWSKWVTGTSL